MENHQSWQYLRRKRSLSVVLLSALLYGCGGTGAVPATPIVPTSPKQIVTVSGNQILRDGVLWVPHPVQLVAFVAPPKAQTGQFAAAYAHYSTAELSAIKAWGADSVRFQLSQPGADPTNTAGLYDPIFVQQFVAAVKDARSLGLNVIVSIQDESQSGESMSTVTALPNPVTNSVWKNLAPMLNGDDGIRLRPWHLDPELVPYRFRSRAVGVILRWHLA